MVHLNDLEDLCRGGFFPQFMALMQKVIVPSVFYLRVFLPEGYCQDGNSPGGIFSYFILKVGGYCLKRFCPEG